MNILIFDPEKARLNPALALCYMRSKVLQELSYMVLSSYPTLCLTVKREKEEVK